MPSTRTVTQTNQTVLPPWLAAQMQGNLGMANWLTSGVLPAQAQPANDPNAVQYGTFDPNNPMGGGVPTFPADMNNGAGQYINPDGTPATPPSTFVAGMRPDQLAAFTAVRNMGTTAPTANQLGAGTFTNLSNFQAPNATAATVANVNPMTASNVANINPMTAAGVANINPMQAASMNAAQVGSAPTVAAGQFAGRNLDPYFNPYRQNVIDPLKADIAANAERVRNAERMNARASGSMRGSGFQVGRALTEGELSRAENSAMGGLYDRMFSQAAGLATGDIDRTLNADTFNTNIAQQRNLAQAGFDQSAAATNAGMQQQAGLTNFDYAGRQAMQNAANQQQAGMANFDWTGRQASQNAANQQQAGMANFDFTGRQALTNAGFTQQTNLANQDAAIRSAGVQAAGATGAAAANQGAWQNQNTATNALLQTGNMQQDLAQRQLREPLDMLMLRQQMAQGSSPYYQGSTGTTTGPGQSTGGLAGAVGGGIAGLGLAGLGGLGPLAAGGATALGPVGWGALGLGALLGGIF